MLLSLKDREKRELLDRLKDGTVVSDSLRKALLFREANARGWDGYIHPSSLDWNKSVEAQVKKLRKEWRPSAIALQRMEVGNLIHEYIQDRNHKHFFGQKSTSEEHIEDHSLLFRGTPDQYGPHADLGTVLMEYKSVSSYQKDKAEADKIIKKLQVPQELYEEVYNRLRVKYIDYSEPCSDHLTQAFTYCFILKITKNIMPKWVCICYIRKETLDTMEFWYEVEKHKNLLVKAFDNYKAVYEAVKFDPDAIKIRSGEV